MTALTGHKVKLTYKDLLQLSNSNGGLAASPETVYDGAGVASPLKLSTTQVVINGNIMPSGYGNNGQALFTDGAGTLSWGNTALLSDIPAAVMTFTNKSGNISQWTNDSGYITSSFVPTTITVANEVSDHSCFVGFFNSATGDMQPKTNAGLTFASDTGILSATGFSGPLTGNVTGDLTGNVTGNVSGSSGSCTGNAATVTNLTVSGTSTISGDNTGDQLTFKTVAVSGQSDVVAGTITDTLNLIAGANVVITTNAGTNSVTIASSGGGGGGGGLSDGDYGDITVSGSGTVMTIPNDTVTYAKMQNVSATNMVLGRHTAGAGDVEEISLTITPGASISGTNTGDQTSVSGSSGSCTGNAATATALATARAIGGVNFDGTAAITPNNITVAADATNATFYIPFFSSATGALQPKSDTDLTYNPSTNVLTVGSVSGTLTGSVTGNASTATALQTARSIGGVNFDGTANIVPTTITVANEATDTTCFPAFFVSATGDLLPKTNASFTFNSNTASLACTTFVGALTGNASTATALQTARAIGGVNFDGTVAITPANITIANEATDTTCFPLFTTAATGDLPPKSNANLTFNSNTASLACTTFVGALTGNVTGNVTGSSGSCTGNAATVTTNANLTGEVTSTGNAAVINQTSITNRTEDTAPEAAADFVLTYDNSAAVLKKVRLQKLGVPLGLAYCMAIQNFCG